MAAQDGASRVPNLGCEFSNLVSTPIIQLEDFRKTYTSGEVQVHAVRGVTLTIQQGVAYFIQWLVTGIVMGLIYRPL